MNSTTSLPGLVTKIAVMCVVAGLGVWAALPLIGAGEWIGLGIVVAVTALLFYLYLSPRRVPAKYLVPGTLLLIAFQLLPVIITISTSTTNLGDGHRGTKEEVIDYLEATSVKQREDAPTYALTVAYDGSGDLVFLLTDADGKFYAGDETGLKPLAESDVEATSSGKILEAEGYTPLTGEEIGERDAEIAKFAVPVDDGGIRTKGLNEAYEGVATRKYEADCDCIVDAKTGHRWTADDAVGSFVDDKGEKLAQGWEVNVGASNFTRVLTDDRLRGPFVSVLVWNLIFAAGTVLLVFVLGLACAMALNHDRLRGRKIYRAIVILPYAMPAFGMLLVWRDMFNADYGLINQLSGLDIAWFGHTGSARLAVLLVNLWLGFPYMFLISTGALQAIPRDTLDAAKIDGASAPQAFRKVTLPLLLVALTPLLISSFAFNFNNFNVIQLTTGGGPFTSDSSSAGGTDLLITYTFRLAFGGQGADYGYAAAISAFIFVIVAVISAVSFRTTRRQEEVYR
ncbi:ABC transporter permease subunit [Stackebrandtia nassauensis]|uniref:Maltose/maltodextrin transport system permease protein n=1 Tax=Stackebrandtia nassauensis (strain DSM 44728 / CIP 108903 / NRRL B-16338 / NBRC 102104 / LLR-40K-21) TaxID=446470 RepID=D3PZ89_STANL|nr:ABC transporter permease subunit [Stackebrandtia nassauensis]ADD45518.1 binding-protein-dependent transport systems inner membrane component [Stackebrandtia nassauensis DSM 44728]